MAETYTLDAPNIALTAATALYMAGLATSSSVDCDLERAFFSGDSTSAGTLKVELVTWTSDGTGTAYTLKKRNAASQGRAAVTTAKTDYTVAPTGTITVLETKLFAVPIGGYEIELPLSRECHMPISTFMGWRFTSSVNQNGYLHAEIEE